LHPDNIRTFFKNNGYYPSEDEVVAVVRRLDTDADAKVNYSEFCEAIKSQEFTKLKETLNSSPQRGNPLSTS
jgi:Ca2+-binding EF-hand superfamily protein